MKFRPCIDIHNGKVKQIIGSSLKDAGDQAAENFVSQQDGAFYARLYRKYGLEGGHIILLNAASSEYYESTRQAGSVRPDRLARPSAAGGRREPGQRAGLSSGREPAMSLSPPMYSGTDGSTTKIWTGWSAG